jgi:hypothetical protein
LCRHVTRHGYRTSVCNPLQRPEIRPTISPSHAEYAAKDRKPPVPSDRWPALRQFSDIAWIGWDSMTESDEVKGLRYFLAVGIINPEIKQVIRRALDAKGWDLSPWPGHMFERSWPETQALIGSSTYRLWEIRS